MSIAILQVSDAHLSPRRALFRANMERLRLAMRATPPDLVVASGDLSLDGADHDADLEFAQAAHLGFGAPLLAVPGNHDVGSHPHTMPRQPVDAARLARWEARFGPNWWLRDLPGWRLVGLNTEIMGTGLAAEAAQAAFIAEAAAGAGERRIALFQHKPAFVTTPEDPSFDYWSVPPQARPALAPLLAHPALRLVASGHLHVHYEFRLGRVAFVWAPSLAFFCNPAEQPGIAGTRPCGALLHRLHSDHVETTLLEPQGMDMTCFDDIRAETYPA